MEIEGEPMPIIAIVSTKGGTGKTTTAYNLALELKPDSVLDQDLHTGLRVISQMRDEPLPFPLYHYESDAAMLDALQDMAARDEMILVDVGGFDSDIARAVVAVADLIITPCNDTPTDRIGLGRFEMMLAEVSAAVGGHLKAHLLLCKAHPSRKHFPRIDEALASANHLTRMRTVINDRPDHYRSHENGLGVTERTATRHTAAGQEIAALAEEIRQLLSA